MKVTEIKNGKVRCVGYEKHETYFTLGKVYEVKNNTIVNDNGYKYTSPNVMDYLSRWYKFEIVEEKFTKDDIKTGMFGVMTDGEKFVIVDDLIVYEKGAYDRLNRLNNDLEFSMYKIEKLYKGCLSFNQLKDTLNGRNFGTLVYDRKRDTKPALYNGKVVCVDVGTNTRFYTVGKIYQFVDGVLTSDNDISMSNHGKPFTSFEEWSKWTGSKFIEIKE